MGPRAAGGAGRAALTKPRGTSGVWLVPMPALKNLCQELIDAGETPRAATLAGLVLLPHLADTGQFEQAHALPDALAGATRAPSGLEARTSLGLGHARLLGAGGGPGSR